MSIQCIIYPHYVEVLRSSPNARYARIVDDFVASNWLRELIRSVADTPSVTRQGPSDAPFRRYSVVTEINGQNSTMKVYDQFSSSLVIRTPGDDAWQLKEETDRICAQALEREKI